MTLNFISGPIDRLGQTMPPLKRKEIKRIQKQEAIIFSVCSLGEKCSPREAAVVLLSGLATMSANNER